LLIIDFIVILHVRLIRVLLNINQSISQSVKSMNIKQSAKETSN